MRVTAVGDFSHLAWGWSKMSGFERLLEPGCTEQPICRCGQEMDFQKEATQVFAYIIVPRAA